MPDFPSSLFGIHLDSPWFILLLPLVLLTVAIGWWLPPPTLIVSSLRPYREAARRGLATAMVLRLPLLLHTAGLVLLAVALIRPQRGIEQTQRRTRGVDIIIALDVSGSMEVFDLPDADQMNALQFNRLVREQADRPRIRIAKEEVKRFVELRPDDRIGLVAFASRAYTACPPTLDHGFLLQHLERLDAGMLQDALTGIAQPITTAASRLRESEAKRRVIVLFTDGASNREARITPRQAAELAAMFDITIHTVGIGSKFGFVIRRGIFGNPKPQRVQADLDEALLRDIADLTGGRYFHAEDQEGLEAAMKAIDALEKVEIEQTVYTDYRDLFPPLLTVGGLLLLAAYLLEHTLLLRLP